MAYDIWGDQDDKDRSWMTQAACDGEPAHIFFLEDEPASQRDNVARAKAICYRCPVRERCLDMALNNNERYGIWGATTPRERIHIRRDRRQQGL